MSRSPNCELEEEAGWTGAGDSEVALRIGLGARVVKGAVGLRVRPLRGKASRVPSQTVRWAMKPQKGPAKLLLPQETTDDARATLELVGGAPDLRRCDWGPVLRSRFSFRVEVGPKEAWFIVIVPTNGQAWDGRVFRTAGQYASHVADVFLRFAVADWPTSGPLPIRYGPRMGPDTRLRMPASFPRGTPMLTAGRPLAPQMRRRKLEAITLLPVGLRVDAATGCIRQVGDVPTEVQPGCSMGLAVDTSGHSRLVCFYVPSAGAVSPPLMAEVAKRLRDRVYTRRHR
jgi:hypothetical protein